MVRPAVLVGFAATVVLIGLNFVAVRLSNIGLAPTWGAAIRFGIAAWIMMAVVLAWRIPVPHGRALLGAAWYGTLMFAVFFGFIYWGLVAVPAATASIITSSVPLLTFLAAFAIGLERFHWSAIAGAAIVMGGIAFLVGSDAGHAPLMRLGAVGVAAMAAALGGVVVKAFPRSHPLATNAVGMAVAFLLLLAASALRGEHWAVPGDGATWMALAYLVGSSLVLFPLMVWVIGEWTASANAYAMVMAPLVTVPVGAIVLGEAIGARFAVAALLIVGGVYVGALWRPSSE